MNRPATIDGIALIASTIMRTGRREPAADLVEEDRGRDAERHREQRRDADHLERADDRGRPAALGRRARAGRPGSGPCVKNCSRSAWNPREIV